MAGYLYTNSSQGAATATGLSTQILIQVDGQSVGAIQSLDVSQSRNVERVVEVGTDGTIEIVPNKATETELQVDRIYFDKKRMTEAFSRGFLNIHAQRVPFDIVIYDFSNAESSNSPTDNPATLDITAAFDVADSSAGLITTIYENCWFTKLSTKHSATDYIITESASISCEFAHSFKDGNITANASRGTPTFDDALERIADVGRRGSLDARGLGRISDVFAGLGTA